MEKTAKYEFTSETKTTTDDYGETHVVRQIRALRDIEPSQKADKVHANDLGGWIETEHNLSHSGECWVDEDACVFGRAIVINNAYVGGFASESEHAYVVLKKEPTEGYKVLNGRNTKVYGQARICGDAHVGGNAIICGDALIRDRAEIIATVKIKGYVEVKGSMCIYDNYAVVMPADYEIKEEDKVEACRIEIGGAITFTS